MKKKLSHVAYALCILIYYSFFILDSALSDTEKNSSDIPVSQDVPANFNSPKETEESVHYNNDNVKIGKDLEANGDIQVNLVSPSGGSAVFSEVTSHDFSGIINDTPVILTSTDSATKELGSSEDIQESTDVDTKVLVTDTNTTLLNESETPSDQEPQVLNITKNTTEEKTEEIPSFSEWAQKHLEEAEKKEPANASTPGYALNSSGAKLRWKNYASLDCGAKVVQANPEAQNTWAVLSPSRDEYKLSPCNSRVWFVVELCEAIQVKKVDIANYELFSSSPKDFAVSISDRYPTREWSVAGHFTAKDERDIQSFDLNHEHFGKYVKIEIKSHYGSEHYCPLSLFRAYGTSVFEVLQKEDPAHMQEDDEDDIPESTDKSEPPANLLSSATDAVISMVKKAAQVLGNKGNNATNMSSNKTLHSSLMETCNSPSHYVVCKNCSDVLFGRIYQLLSCKPSEVMRLAKEPFIMKTLVQSEICTAFGLDFFNKSSPCTLNSCPSCVTTFFPAHYLGAMCNILAVAYNKVLQNVSYHYANSSEYLKTDNLINISVPLGKNHSIGSVIDPTKPLLLDQVEVQTKPAFFDSFNVSEIKPSKSVPTEEDLSPTTMDSEATAQENNDPKIIETKEETSDIVETDNIEDNLENLITEINAADVVSSTLPSSPSLQAQKESVFLRLSNRIKALERNMSLSGQYLEELSKRYKKQVEEIQKTLEKTIRALEDVNAKQDEKNRQLEKYLSDLKTDIDNVIADRNSWKWTCCVVTFIFMTFLAYIFLQRFSADKSTAAPDTKAAPLTQKNKKQDNQQLKIVLSSKRDRSNSLKSTVKKKRKSHLVHVDPSLVTGGSEGGFAPKRTSTKIWNFDKEKCDWVEGQKSIEDIPFPLDESDNCSLEVMPDFVPPSKPPTQNGENQKTHSRTNSNPIPANGTLSNGVDNTPKSAKKSLKKLLKKVF